MLLVRNNLSRLGGPLRVRTFAGLSPVRLFGLILLYQIDALRALVKSDKSDTGLRYPIVTEINMNYEPL